VWGKKVEAEGEVGGGEDGEGFGEDVCDRFVAGEGGVELVSGSCRKGGRVVSQLQNFGEVVVK